MWGKKKNKKKSRGGTTTPVDSLLDDDVVGGAADFMDAQVTLVAPSSSSNRANSPRKPPSFPESPATSGTIDPAGTAAVSSPRSPSGLPTAHAIQPALATPSSRDTTTARSRDVTALHGLPRTSRQHRATIRSSSPRREQQQRGHHHHRTTPNTPPNSNRQTSGAAGILRRSGGGTTSSSLDNNLPLQREVTFSSDLTDDDSTIAIATVLPREFIPSRGDYHIKVVEGGKKVMKLGAGRPSVVFADRPIPTDILQRLSLKRRSKKTVGSSSTSSPSFGNLTTRKSGGRHHHLPTGSTPFAESNSRSSAGLYPTTSSAVSVVGGSSSTPLYPSYPSFDGGPSSSMLHHHGVRHSSSSPAKLEMTTTTTQTPNDCDDDDDIPSLQRGTTAPIEEGSILQSSVDVYYFETTYRGGNGFYVGLNPSTNNAMTFDSDKNIPGKAPNSIGLAQDGIVWVNGKPIPKPTSGGSSNTMSSSSSGSKSSWLKGTSHSHLRVGDTIGCGLEVLGMRRIFFTCNGKLLAPPSSFDGLNLPDNLTIPCIALSSGEVVVEFGFNSSSSSDLQSSSSFVWKGSDRLSLIPPTERIMTEGGTSSRRPPSSTTTSSGSGGSAAAMLLSGTSGSGGGIPPAPPSFGSSSGGGLGSNGLMSQQQVPVYGRKARNKSSLEDDVPSDTTVLDGFMNRGGTRVDPLKAMAEAMEQQQRQQAAAAASTSLSSSLTMMGTPSNSGSSGGGIGSSNNSSSSLLHGSSSSGLGGGMMGGGVSSSSNNAMGMMGGAGSNTSSGLGGGTMLGGSSSGSSSGIATSMGDRSSGLSGGGRNSGSMDHRSLTTTTDRSSSRDHRQTTTLRLSPASSSARKSSPSMISDATSSSRPLHSMMTTTTSTSATSSTNDTNTAAASFSTPPSGISQEPSGLVLFNNDRSLTTSSSSSSSMQPSSLSRKFSGRSRRGSSSAPMIDHNSGQELQQDSPSDRIVGSGDNSDHHHNNSAPLSDLDHHVQANAAGGSSGTSSNIRSSSSSSSSNNNVSASNTTTTTTATGDDDEMMQAALQRSVMGKPKRDKSKMMIVTPQEMEDHKACARELRTISLQRNADVGLIRSMLEVCQTIQQKLKKNLEDAMKYDPSMIDLEELFHLNDFVLEAIDTAKKKIEEKEGGVSSAAAGGGGGVGSSSAAGSSKLPPSTSQAIGSSVSSLSRVQSNHHHHHNPAPIPTQKVQRRQTTRSLEIDALVKKKDIFSLICMLRAQSDKRLDSALALMRFAREAERKGDGESIRLRNEIRSSGGMHSLLTLFRTRGTTRELRVVAALAVAYLLPSVAEAGSLTSVELCLKVVECLRFLFSQKPVSPKSEEIPRHDMINASAMGLTTFWIHAFYPLLQKEGSKKSLSAESPDGVVLERKSTTTRVRARNLQLKSGVGGGGGSGGTKFADQRQESMEIQQLLEMTVSLIVNLAKLSDDHDGSGSGGGSSPTAGRLHSSDSKVNLRYTLVEQMCAVDLARPIAVREGLLKVLVSWMKSKDREKIRPAATALRDLTSTKDKYMAGWIHSQIVNEGALGLIVELSVSQTVGHDVRLGVAQILSSLCVAPHTRAAVVEAQCINYLIPLLWDHGDPSSQQVAYAAGTALLQLAEGAMTFHAGAHKSSDNMNDAVSPDKRDSVINDILEGGAVGPFVAMAGSKERNKLRAMSIEALRVISEDTNPARSTRLQLCEDGAAESLGSVLRDDVVDVIRILNPTTQENHQELRRSTSLTASDMVKEVHDALCALSNILEPADVVVGSTPALMFTKSRFEDPERTRIRACLQIANSGGLKSLLYIAKLPLNGRALRPEGERMEQSDLLVEASRCLAGLSPLLLSDQAAAQRHSAWASEVLQALSLLLKQAMLLYDEYTQGLSFELKIDSLRGLNALATSEPLRIRIIDRSLSQILQAKGDRGDRDDVTIEAGKLCISLGFADDELAVQAAGNDPKLLSDWFCLQRSMLIQAMAREELRRVLVRNWREAIDEAKSKGLFPPAKLGRQGSVNSASSSGLSRSNSSEALLESGIQEFFEHLSSDTDSAEERNILLRQYENVYEVDVSSGGDAEFSEVTRGALITPEGEGLLAPHVYPLNDCLTEKDWILEHRQVLRLNPQHHSSLGRVEKLLDCCIPSRLLQHDILPLYDLRPEASFDFRALVMPQRRYFSFRREGQLLSRLCEKHSAAQESDDVHWTLGFTNSSFAGEFSDTLVQVLYRCPMIRGLSFVRNKGWENILEVDKENDASDGSAILANLAALLPPWVSYLTYDNVLNNRAVQALVAILEKMKELGAGQTPLPADGSRLATAQHGQQKQGVFTFFAIRNSPHLSRDVWDTFFKLLGNPEPGRLPSLCPLASLQVLDLSGNGLGDEACSYVLAVIHRKGSGCCIEQVDLSKNNIGEGKQVTKVIRSYIESHRYNQTAGVKMTKQSWRSPLHTLNLASNNLATGGLVLEIVALLKNNALALRSLDLSDNDLANNGYEFTSEVLCASITKNSCLRELDLSGNSFNDQFVDGLLFHLGQRGAETGLSFLKLDRNMPELSESQKLDLETVLRRSRKVAFERFLSDQERIKSGNVLDDPVIAERNPSLTDAGLRERLSAIDKEDTFDMNEELARTYSPTEKGGNMITVLFSAPLVFHDEQRRLRPFAKLDFAMERDLIWHCLKEASRDIELSFDTATHHRLLATMTKRSSCLHYSGHGHPSYLPFENGKGGPHWLQVNEIREMVSQEGGAPFKMVFVSACHSGLAGETFASAGVPHVVCCQQESELKDTAALAFTRQFYLALTIGHTVKEAFEQGCKAVRATPNLRNPEVEMKKFVLLPRDGNHDVPVFNAKPLREWPNMGSSRVLQQQTSRPRRGKSLMRSRSLYFGGARSSELSVRNMMQEDPSPTPPQDFMGREVDMYKVLGSILTKRLVSVVGEPGVGRSSLVCSLCHYVNERSSTIMEIDQIFYVKTKQARGDRCQKLIRSLLDKLVEAEKAHPPNDGMDLEDLFEAVCKALKNTKALIVFDRTELLEGEEDAQDFPMFLSTLFRETRNVRVVLTSRHPLGIPSLGGVVEQPHYIRPLDFANTVRLFAKLSPELHTPKARQDFFHRVVAAGDSCQADLCIQDHGVDERTKIIFAKLGNGMPDGVEKAAYTLREEVATLGT